MTIQLRTGQTDDSEMDARRRAVLARLAEATELLLADRSLSDVSLTDIIEAAHVAKATVYKLFEDRDHLLQFVTERLLAICREYQLRDHELADPEDWRDIYTRLCDNAAAFYRARPAAVRLWLANDSPASNRAVDQESDAAFLDWMRSTFSGTRWHARLPDPVKEVDVLTASLRIYDAVLVSGFCRADRHVPIQYFNEAKRACLAYLATYLDSAR